MTNEVLINELNVLRSELRDLKGCQIQYVSLSVTGTGAIVGFAGTLASPEFRGMACLAPLIILLPCWWIFFDKATTITRLVGYVRMLETMIAGSTTSSLVYYGYENALAGFRQRESEFPPPPSQGLISTLSKVLRLRTRHRFWTVNWYTFASLSAVSWSLALRFLQGGVLERSAWLSVSGILVVASAVLTLRMVRELIVGKYSYEHTTFVWNQILRVNTDASAGGTPVGALHRAELGVA